MQLVLASQSPARAQLLRDARVAFTSCPARVDEAAIKAVAQGSVVETALLLADAKAQQVGADYPDALVIGADQILVCDDRWFDKPESLQDAKEQLLFLHGKTHVLVTSVVCWQGGRQVWNYVAQPQLTMRCFSDTFLDSYIHNEAAHVLHCVGAYRLEGMGVQLFAQINGAFSDILGLPLLPLLEFLRQHGVLRN